MTNPAIKYQNNEELLLDKAGHSYRYYGVDREDNPEAIKEIEEYLKSIWPNITRFCNYTTNEDGTKSLRVLCDYGSSWGFIGVAYIRLDRLPITDPETDKEY